MSRTTPAPCASAPRTTERRRASSSVVGPRRASSGVVGRRRARPRRRRVARVHARPRRRVAGSRIAPGAGRTVAGASCRQRKVRTPSGRVLVNGQAQQVERPKATESGTENRPPMAWRHVRAPAAAGARRGTRQARVKRRGKSSPRSWRHERHAKPHPEQHRIGTRPGVKPERTARPSVRVGGSSAGATLRPEE